MAQQRRALEHFYRVHAQGSGEVIRRRVGVGRRCDQYAVFHQGYLATTLTRGPPNTDIGSQAIPIFLTDINAGYGLQQLVDIVGGLDANLAVVHYRAGAGQRPRLFLAADDGDLFQCVAVGIAGR